MTFDLYIAVFLIATTALCWLCDSGTAVCERRYWAAAFHACAALGALNVAHTVWSVIP